MEQFPLECYNEIPDINTEYICLEIEVKSYNYTIIVRDKGFTHLMKLVLCGNDPNVINLINDILKKNPEEINKTTKSRGWTALMLACTNYKIYKGDYTIIKILLGNSYLDINKGINIRTSLNNTYSMDFLNCLGVCCIFENQNDEKLELVKLLLEHEDIEVNKISGQDKTILMYACENKSVKTVELLLKNPNTIVDMCCDKLTAMSLTCKHKEDDKSLGIIKLLLENGISTETIIKSLKIAAQNNNVEIVKLLLKTNIKIKQDKYDRILMPAKQYSWENDKYCSTGMAKLIFMQPDFKFNEKAHLKLVERLYLYEFVLKNQIFNDINYVDEDGNTLFMLFCIKLLCNDGFKVLRSYSINVNHRNKCDEDALYWACRNENVEAVKIIADYPHAKLYCRNYNVFTKVCVWNRVYYNSENEYISQNFRKIMEILLKHPELTKNYDEFLGQVIGFSLKLPLHLNNEFSVKVDFEAVKLLLSQNDLEIGKMMFTSVLNSTCCMCDKKTIVDIIGLLLKYNIKHYYAYNDCFDSALFYCLANHFNPNIIEAIKLLLNQNFIDINKLYNDHYPLIMVACNPSIVLCGNSNGIKKWIPNNTDNLEIFKLFLRPNLNVNILDSSGCSILYYALHNLEKFVFLLNNFKLNLNTTDIGGNTILMEACMLQNNEFFKILLNCPDINFYNKNASGKTIFNRCLQYDKKFKMLLDVPNIDVDYLSILREACGGSHLEIIKLLLNKKEIDSKIINNVFIEVCKCSNIEIIKLFLSRSDININFENSCGETFFAAVCKNSNSDVIKYVINNFATVGEIENCISKINICNLLLNYPKFNICYDKLKLLCELSRSYKIDFNFNHKYENGETILMIQCKNNNIDNVGLLLSNFRIDVNVQDDNGNTALMLSNNQIIIKLLLSCEDININTQNNKGECALIKFCQNNCVKFVHLLLNKKEINKNVTDNHGNNILMMACKNNYYELVRYLLQNKVCDINQQNYNKTTCLMTSCDNNNKPLTKLLLEQRDINLDVHNSKGENILTQVLKSSYCKNGDLEILKLLINFPKIRKQLFSDEALVTELLTKFDVDIAKIILLNHSIYRLLDIIDKINAVQANLIFDGICAFIGYYSCNPLFYNKILAKLNYENTLEINKRSYYLGHLRNNVLPYIKLHGEKLYAQPNNILPLCLQVDFNSDFYTKSELYQNLDPKLKFLFDIKDEDDLMEKIRFYL